MVGVIIYYICCLPGVFSTPWVASITVSNRRAFPVVPNQPGGAVRPKLTALCKTQADNMKPRKEEEPSYTCTTHSHTALKKIAARRRNISVRICPEAEHFVSGVKSVRPKII